MSQEKEAAKQNLASRILGCFDLILLRVSAGIGAGETTEALRDLCQRARLDSKEVQLAIEPKIKEFLETGYMAHADNAPRAWSNDDEKVRAQARTMASDIAWELTRPARKRR